MQVDYKGFTISVELDTNPEDPRSWDNFGTMICYHPHYNLGDKHKLSMEEAGKIYHNKNVVALPLFLYDHSGITISTTPFSCPWDSGQIGFIYVTKDDVRKEFGRITKKVLEKVNKCLESEVKVYDEYLRGDVYCFTVENDEGEIIDSCGGFFGDGDYCFEEAKRAIDYIIKG